MRDILDEIYKNNPLDPMEAARQAVRPNLRRRFYQQASVGKGDKPFPVLLDGRPVRTPARQPLALPTPALAAAVAAEWEAQTEVVDPARMPLTRLVNTIIDGVARQTEAVAEDVQKYLGSDLLFYRADRPEGLIARQAQAWDPVLAWAREALNARFILVAGVIHVAQPGAAIARARTAIPTDPWPLGAVHSMMTLTGSALLALAVLKGRLTAEEAWAAAHVDEDWNMDFWGQDELALQRRAFRFADMQAAARVISVLD